MKTKKKVFDFINTNPIFTKFIYGLIILNVISIILESYNEIKIEYSSQLYYFEVFSVIIFSFEYVLRFWTSDLEYKTGTKFLKRLKFSTSTYGLIDILAILPFYLPLLFPFDLRVLRILRLFRLLRIFKLGRLSKSMKTITSVLKDSKSELSITIFVAFILLILSSTLMYYVESDVQPEKFENIGQALWWSVATLTTVGYGDVYPITGVGKFLSAIIALIGIGFVALPTGIISSAFVERIQSEKRKKLKQHQCKCPSCGIEH
ncbi:ion transporter [Aestuariibaculum sp. M13]|uniref:ion transporter n=1 Tax=Aestuariibaculum sp. M13 TaxID=2967132 RepID=UPI00215A068A|nr:ion transporter [Aestuariibaculum sp. M13]MCR8667891.1 ion transporter [Aestuariibaculum sp. M13]